MSSKDNLQIVTENTSDQVISRLAKELTNAYGSGFDASNLYKFLEFYRAFPKILDAARLKSIRLTWTHYRTLLQVHEPDVRKWYENEAAYKSFAAEP